MTAPHYPAECSPAEAYTLRLAHRIGHADTGDWPSLALAWLLAHPDMAIGRTLDRALYIAEGMVRRYYATAERKVIATAKASRSAA